MIVVGLTGKARSGKNAFAEGLLKTHRKMRPDASQHMLAFADPLRDMLYDLNPMIPWQNTAGVPNYLSAIVDTFGWEGLKGTGYYAEVRRLMQRFGTDVMRKRDEDYWVKQMDARVYKMLDNPALHLKDSLIVISDVRFANEAEYVKEYNGGTVVLIDRPGVTTDAATEAHFSEALEGIRPDDIIINDESIEALEDIAYVTMKILLRREEARVRLARSFGKERVSS